MHPPRFLLRLPAYAINGIGVAIGIALIEIVLGTAAGPLAALTATTGAIFSSLADVPLVPERTWRRVGTAGALGCLSSLLVSLLAPYPWAMGVGTVGIAFVSGLILAWGPRAGAVSFVPVLALVFAMAAPPEPGLIPVARHVAWSLLGALLYLGWATLTACLLQPRYRSLAFANALQAMADLLRSRAAVLAQDPILAGAPPLQAWIQRQAALDERLQAARDMLFAAPATPEVQRRITMLFHVVDLRDTLLGSELDLDLLGRDIGAQRLREALVANNLRIAAAIEAIAQAERSGAADAPAAVQAEAARPIDTQALLAALAPDALFPDDTAQRALARALLDRARHMLDDVTRLQTAMHGAPAAPPLGPAELRLFVSPEGWPLAALRAQFKWASPVMRHALRCAVALGSAYTIGLMLPWAAHPHWLVLSVGVVLRGNLEQTLARRDARIAGTVIGCLIVMVLARSGLPWLSTVVFLASVGIAHSFVLQRYLVTAAAASVMALLQAHLAHPEGGFGIGERLADTVLGALLAWGFSFVLPWWERRSVAMLVERVLRALRNLSREVLRWPDAAAPDLTLRLARREVYEAIGAIAMAAQRTRAEPEDVQLPLYALATLLTRCHQLLAQLAAVRTMLTRRGQQLEPTDALGALQATAAELERLLGGQAPAPAADPAMPPPGAADLRLPPPDAPLLPWLLRRLHLCQQVAGTVADAARGVRAAAG